MFYILAPLKAQFHFALGPMHYLADPQRKRVALLLWPTVATAQSERNGMISSHQVLHYFKNAIMLITLYSEVPRQFIFFTKLCAC